MESDVDYFTFPSDGIAQQCHVWDRLFPQSCRDTSQKATNERLSSQSLLPLSVPVSPASCEKKMSIVALKTGGSPTCSPGTAVGQQRQTKKVIRAWECLTSRKQSEHSHCSGNCTGNMESNPFLPERKDKRKSFRPWQICKLKSEPVNSLSLQIEYRRDRFASKHTVRWKRIWLTYLLFFFRQSVFLYTELEAQVGGQRHHFFFLSTDHIYEVLPASRDAKLSAVRIEIKAPAGWHC